MRERSGCASRKRKIGEIRRLRADRRRGQGKKGEKGALREKI